MAAARIRGRLLGALGADVTLVVVGGFGAYSVVVVFSAALPAIVTTTSILYKSFNSFDHHLTGFFCWQNLAEVSGPCD